MPRDNDTKICETYEEIDCMINASFHWMKNKTADSILVKPCNCLLACRSIEYMVTFDEEMPLNEFLTDEPVKLPKK